MKIYATLTIYPTAVDQPCYYMVSAFAVETDGFPVEVPEGTTAVIANSTLLHSQSPSGLQSTHAAAVRGAFGAPLLTQIYWTVHHKSYPNI